MKNSGGCIETGCSCLMIIFFVLLVVGIFSLPFIGGMIWQYIVVCVKIFFWVLMLPIKILLG